MPPMSHVSSVSPVIVRRSRDFSLWAREPFHPSSAYGNEAALHLVGQVGFESGVGTFGQACVYALQTPLDIEHLELRSGGPTGRTQYDSSCCE